MSAIVTVTMNPTVDMSTDIDHVVANRKLLCGRPIREPGGGGINVARAIRRLGGEARAIFAAGGVAGARLTALVADDGVESHPIEIAEETRESVNVTERSSGAQFRFVMEGPSLRESEWTAVLDAVRELSPAPEYLVASGTLPAGVPVDFYGRLSRLAAERHIRLIVDTSGEPLPHAIGPGTFLVKPNLAEFRELAGVASGAGAFTDFFLEGAASALVGAGRTNAVVISLGAGGAIVATAKSSQRILAPTVKVDSRVGAGDSMVAGIVLALTRGLSVEDAATFGVAAGTAAVMTPGTQLCRREDTERLYDEMKNRVA